MREITLETKIADLLNEYDGMKDILIGINPKFKKLNNPVLRRTLGKVAGVKQAAMVGGMDPLDLLNQLRIAVGQPALDTSDEGAREHDSSQEQIPDWIDTAPSSTINANEILDNDGNPLAEATKILRGLNDGEIMSIVSDFRPEPLIDEYNKNHEVYCQQIGDKDFVTYIRK